MSEMFCFFVELIINLSVLQVAGEYSGYWAEDLATALEEIKLKMWHSRSGDGGDLAPAHEGSSAESYNVSFNFTKSIK